MTIGDRIKKRRKELHMSADKLADILGKDRSTIYRYEKGDIENLPIDILKPIADALGTSPSYLMGWTDEETQKKNDNLTEIIVRLKQDEDFANATVMLGALQPDQFDTIKQLLATLVKK